MKLFIQHICVRWKYIFQNDHQYSFLHVFLFELMMYEHIIVELKPIELFGDCRIRWLMNMVTLNLVTCRWIIWVTEVTICILLEMDALYWFISWIACENEEAAPDVRKNTTTFIHNDLPGSQRFKSKMLLSRQKQFLVFIEEQIRVLCCSSRSRKQLFLVKLVWTSKKQNKKVPCKPEPGEPRVLPSLLAPQFNSYQPIPAEHRIEKMQSAHFQFTQLLIGDIDQLISWSVWLHLSFSFQNFKNLQQFLGFQVIVSVWRPPRLNEIRINFIDPKLGNYTVAAPKNVTKVRNE